MRTWIVENARNVLFVVSLAAVATGAAAYSWPLGLIVPGVLVMGLLVLSQLRG